MPRPRKILLKTVFILLLALPVVALVHYLVFPQETRNILIDYSDFKKINGLYFKQKTAKSTIDSLQSLIDKASNRVAGFYGRKTVSPKFIYCDNDDDFKKEGNAALVPAVTHFKLSAYIVISREGLDLDIVAHEIAHAEFYNRIGFYNKTFKIPVWFDEGLAMLNDYRTYYSEDTLKIKSNNYTNMPAIQELKTPAQFYNGTYDEVMLHFMVARHEVKKWYAKARLNQLIADLNSGKSFDEAYNSN